MALSFSWWFMLLVILFFIPPAYAAFEVWYEGGNPLLGFGIGFVASLLIVGVINGIAYTNTDNPGQSTVDQYVTDSDIVAEAYGFRWDQSYPLELGSKVSSFSADLNASSFIFTDATATVTGGSAISIGFEHEGKSWAIAVPTVTNTIRVSTTEPPSVTLRSSGKYTALYDGERTAIVTISECKLRLHNLVVGCLNQTRETGEYGFMRYDEAAVQKGLSSYVEPLIASSEMVMTPEMRDRLEGRIN